MTEDVPNFETVLEKQLRPLAEGVYRYAVSDDVSERYRSSLDMQNQVEVHLEVFRQFNRALRVLFGVVDQRAQIPPGEYLKYRHGSDQVEIRRPLRSSLTLRPMPT